MPEINLFQHLTEGGNVNTIGMVTLIVLGRGRGAFVTSAFSYSSARKWAEGRSATGIEYRDMTLFMDRFDTYVARVGCPLTTQGHPVQLLELAKEMKASGYEMSEWSLPDEVTDALKPKKPKIEPGPAASENEEADEDNN